MAKLLRKNNPEKNEKNAPERVEIKLRKIMPAIPLRDIVIFPGMVTPLLIGRQKTVNAVEEAQSLDNLVVLVFQKNAEVEEPVAADLYPVAILARILQVMRQSNGQMKLLVESLFRVKLTQVSSENRFFAVSVEPMVSVREKGTEEEALVRLLVEALEKYLQVNPILPREVLGSIFSAEEPEKLSDMVAGYLPLKKEDKAQILDISEITPRLRLILKILNKEIEVLEVQKHIQGEVFKKIEKNQRDYILQEQMKTIQQELGKETETSEVKALQDKIEAANMPEPVKKKAQEELDRFSKMMSLSPEATVIRNYLDWLISLPWQKSTADNLDIKRAEKILNEDHYEKLVI